MRRLSLIKILIVVNLFLGVSEFHRARAQDSTSTGVTLPLQAPLCKDIPEYKSVSRTPRVEIFIHSMCEDDAKYHMYGFVYRASYERKFFSGAFSKSISVKFDKLSSYKEEKFLSHVISIAATEPDDLILSRLKVGNTYQRCWAKVASVLRAEIMFSGSDESKSMGIYGFSEIDKEGKKFVLQYQADRRFFFYAQDQKQWMNVIEKDLSNSYSLTGFYYRIRLENNLPYYVTSEDRETSLGLVDESQGLLPLNF